MRWEDAIKVGLEHLGGQGVGDSRTGAVHKEQLLYKKGQVKWFFLCYKSLSTSESILSLVGSFSHACSKLCI